MHCLFIEHSANFLYILKRTSHKTAVVQLLTSYLKNHPNKERLITNILLRIPSHGHTSIDQPAKAYINQLCMDTGCSLEDLPNAIANRDIW